MKSLLVLMLLQIDANDKVKMYVAGHFFLRDNDSLRN